MSSEVEEQGLFDVDPKWFKLGFYAFLLIWVGYLLWQTTGFEEFEDYFFPYLLGVPVLALVVLQLVAIRYPELVERVMPDEAPTDTEAAETLDAEVEAKTGGMEGRPKTEREAYEIRMLGWVTLLPFMMYFLGMGWTLLLYVFTFTWYFIRNPVRAFLVTVIVVAFVYVLFIHLLNMIIWTGTLPIIDPLEMVSRYL